MAACMANSMNAAIVGAVVGDTGLVIVVVNFLKDVVGDSIVGVKALVRRWRLCIRELVGLSRIVVAMLLIRSDEDLITVLPVC